jgi:AcrR family transcriptional regulator
MFLQRSGMTAVQRLAISESFRFEFRTSQMATRAKNKAESNGRLDVTAWTAAALDLLSEQGIDGVRIELLARRLGVTKGSFYWHFKDRDELHVAMLDSWRRRTTLGLIERFEHSNASAIERLRQLIRLLIGPKSLHGADVELAVRLWGRRDPRAQAALAEVDELRTRYMARLLTETGMAKDEAMARSLLIYSYMRVAPSLAPLADPDVMALCEDLLLGPAAGK